MRQLLLFLKKIPYLYNSIAFAYRGQSKWKQAEIYLNKVILLKEQSNVDGWEVSFAHYQGGKIMLELKRPQKTIQQFELAINIAQEEVKKCSKLSNKHLMRYADCFSSLGFVYLSYSDNKEVNEAIQYFKKALKVGKKRYSPRQIYIAEIYTNLGMCYQKQENQQQKMLEAFEMADEISHNLTKENDYYMVTNLNLAYLYKDTEQWEKAAKHFLQHLKIARTKKDKIQELISHFKLGDIYKAECKYLTASQHYKQALSIYRQLLDWEK